MTDSPIVSALPLTDDIAPTIDSLVTRQLSAHTRRAYRQDAAEFAAWLAREGLTLARLTLSDIAHYRRYLSDTFANATANRKLTVARKLLDEAVQRGILPGNPAHSVRGFPSDTTETPHTVLTLAQAKRLLSVIDTSTRMGKRDYALILLLLRTGLRRSEVAALRRGDLREEQGYTVAVIQHGKGDKRRSVKIPTDVWQAIFTYLAAVKGVDSAADAPVWVQFRRGDHWTIAPMSASVIHRVVTAYAAQVDLDLSPHGLRATFVTLTLEAGAKLYQVQYAVGHADPRTTERYQKRKLNLADNAVDYLHITKED